MNRFSLFWTALFTISCASAIGIAISTTYSGDVKADAPSLATTPLKMVGEGTITEEKADSADTEFFSQGFIADFPPAAPDNKELLQNNKTSQNNLAKLIADVNAEDADIRAAAIDALANAPKARATPILSALLKARANEDRLLALNSLHTLALHQGDEDGAIRNVFRDAIYDGDDGELAVNAQLALDDVERDLGEVAPTSTH